ncbi:Phosducin-like protein 3 [Balamuthia mandrillaris]
MFRGLPKQNKKYGTEWDDIQRRLGNRPALEESESEEDEPDVAGTFKRKEQVLRERLEATEDKGEIDELEELMDDDKFFQEYRAKRLAEMKSRATKEVYGDITEISQVEYKDAVKTPGAWVVILLYKPSHEHSKLMNERLQELARKFRATRFLKIQAEEAIPGYPERNVPTLLIYFNGDLKKQFVSLSAFHGPSTTLADVEWALSQVGAVDSDMEEDPRGTGGNKIIGLRGGYVLRDSKSDDDDY